jgi:hypothetical protein
MRRSVATLASPSPVVVEHGEPYCELLCVFLELGSVAEPATYQYDQRAATEAVLGDLGPIRRLHKIRHALDLYPGSSRELGAPMHKPPAPRGGAAAVLGHADARHGHLGKHVRGGDGAIGIACGASLELRRAECSGPTPGRTPRRPH